MTDIAPEHLANLLGRQVRTRAHCIEVWLQRIIGRGGSGRVWPPLLPLNTVSGGGLDRPRFSPQPSLMPPHCWVKQLFSRRWM